MYNSPVARYTFVYHQPYGLYIITRKSVFSCGLMRYNTLCWWYAIPYGIDDIQRQAVDFLVAITVATVVAITIVIEIGPVATIRMKTLAYYAHPVRWVLKDPYQILFQVSVTEAGQLLLTLNGQDLEYTVAGRATGTSEIVGMAIITTTAVNSVLTVRNPAGNAAALTITPLAGGTRPVSAHLVITQLAWSLQNGHRT